MNATIIVGSALVPPEEFHRFVLRFSAGGMQLYKDGKRVVQNWSMKIDHEEEADSHGGNANTG